MKSNPDIVLLHRRYNYLFSLFLHAFDFSLTVVINVLFLCGFLAMVNITRVLPSSQNFPYRFWLSGFYKSIQYIAAYFHQFYCWHFFSDIFAPFEDIEEMRCGRFWNKLLTYYSKIVNIKKLLFIFFLKYLKNVSLSFAISVPGGGLGNVNPS